jgi:hypothetical protein
MDDCVMGPKAARCCPLGRAGGPFTGMATAVRPLPGVPRPRPRCTGSALGTGTKRTECAPPIAKARLSKIWEHAKRCHFTVCPILLAQAQYILSECIRK